MRAAPLDIATAACVVDSRSAFYAAMPRIIDTHPYPEHALTGRYRRIAHTLLA